jgi:hypothetical protein
MDAESVAFELATAESSSMHSLAVTSDALTFAQSKVREAQSRAMQQRPSAEPVIHTDSGYRFGAGGSSRAQAPLLDPEIPDELPPTYSER